jgi:hypothetical protein
MESSLATLWMSCVMLRNVESLELNSSNLPLLLLSDCAYDILGEMIYMLISEKLLMLLLKVRCFVMV